MFRLFSLLLLMLCFTMLCMPVSAAEQVPKGVHPVVDMNYGLLFGGTIDGKWVDDGAMMHRLNGGETYRLYSASAYLGTGAGSKSGVRWGAVPRGIAVTPMHGVTIDHTFTLAIDGAWNALPRVPKDENVHQQVYADAVHAILAQHGLATAPVNITRIMRIDLDGDGRDEVLISATTPRQGYPDEHPQSGDYSFVAVRKLIHGHVETILLAGEFYPKTPTESDNATYAKQYTIDGVLDVNGDGVMEVIVGYRELARGRIIYQLVGNKAREVLRADQDV